MEETFQYKCLSTKLDVIVQLVLGVIQVGVFHIPGPMQVVCPSHATQLPQVKLNPAWNKPTHWTLSGFWGSISHSLIIRL